MAEHGLCDICGAEAEYGLDWAFPERLCPGCGHYDYNRATGWRKITSPDEIVRLSSWVREQNAAGVVPVRITLEISRRVAQMPLPRLSERANRALVVIARKYPSLTQPTAFNRMAADLELHGVTYSGASDDVMRLIHILRDEDYVKGLVNTTTNQAVDGYITTKGMLQAEALGASMSTSAQGFVAMWFDPSLDERV